MHLRVLVILLLAVTITTASHPAPLEAAPPSSILHSVVLVGRRNPQTGEYVAIGTAFHVGGGLFRTAAHVATATLPRRYEGRGFDETGLYQADEFGNPARWLGHVEVACVDARWQGRGEPTVFPHDSAVLKLIDGTSPTEFLHASVRRPAPGEAISVWGFPEGSVLFEARSTIGFVSDVWIRFQDALGKPIVGGHSGLPAIDATGGVVGILVGGQRGVLAQNSAVPIRDAEQGCSTPWAGGPTTQGGNR